MSPCVLIVDNEKDMVAVLELILARNDYESMRATSGQQALDLLKASLEPDATPIDLVLLDIMMPDMSGIEVCQAIRQKPAFATLPVMMLTALSSVDDRLLAFDAGADDYLVKPVDHRELLARVQIQLRLRQAERDVRRRNLELVALHTVSDVLNRSLSLNTMLERALAVTCDVLRIDSGAVYLVDDERKHLNLTVSRGLSPTFVSYSQVTRIPIGERHVGRAAATGEAVTKTNLSERPRPTLEIVRDEGLHSAAYIPIKDENDSVTGVLVTAMHTPRDFQKEEIVLLETIGAQLGGALTRARLHEEIEVARDQARALARRITEAQEHERQRIAHELHDQLGQATTALKLDLEILRDTLGPGLPDLDARLAEDIEIASSILSEIQTLSLELRPSVLDDLGLEPALRWYVERFEQRAKLDVELDVKGVGTNQARLTEEVETIAFRCLQEILTNIARHANANSVRIQVRHGKDKFRITTADDGVGFDVDDVLSPTASQYAFGLNGTRERIALVGGTCSITSKIGEGTKVILDIPLDRTGP